MRNLTPRIRMLLSGLLSTSLLTSIGLALEAIRPQPAQSAEEIRIRTVGPLVFTISVDSLETFAETGEITDDFKPYARMLDQQTLGFLRRALSQRLPLDVNTVGHLSYSPLGRDAIENVGKIIQSTPGVNGFHGLRAAVIGAAAQAGPEGWTIIDAMRQFPTNSIDVSIQGLLALRRELSIYFSYNQAAVGAILTEAATEAVSESPSNLANLPELVQPGPYGISRSTITVTNPALRQTAQGLTVNYDFPVDVYLPQGYDQPAPIVIISHGFGAVREDFDFLANHLASYGFVVMLPEHVGSDLSYRKEYLSGRLNTLLSPAEFVNRPQEISFLIDELERLVAASPQWAERLDLNRIGVAGDSLGSNTVLALAGADINFNRLLATCDRENLVLNFALYLECRARFLPPKNYDLHDPRIKAVVAAHPLGAGLYGPEGISKISIPLLMVSGNADIVSPVVTEQIHPFVWLQTEPKYLALLKTGTHFSSKPAGEGAEGIWLLLAGGHRDVGARYYKILSVAFWETYLRDREEYLPYLSASYGKFISEGQPMTVNIIKSLTAEQLAAASGGSTPVPVIPPPVTEAPALRDESILEEIQRTGILKVAMRRDVAPFGFIDDQNQWTGYCPGLVDRLRSHLSQELGTTIELELAELPSTLENRFELVQAGDAYLECGPNSIRTDMPRVTFSNTFFAASTKFLTTIAGQSAVNPALPMAGVRIGVLQDTTTAGFVEQTYPRATITPFSGPSARLDAIQAVIDESIDTFAGDDVLTYAALVDSDRSLNQYALLPNQPPLTCEFYGLILPNDDPAWEAAVNIFMASPAAATVRDQWLGETLPYSLNNLNYCLNN